MYLRIVWITMLALGACDDGSTTIDPVDLDAAVPGDADVEPAPDGPDAEGDVPDVMPDVADLPDAPADSEPDGADAAVVPEAPCAPSEGPVVEPYTLEHSVLAAEAEVGGPSSNFIPINLDGDPLGEVEFVIVRGGRAAVLGSDGSIWWQSPVLSVRRLIGVRDLDGDGRLEVIALGARSVHVFDGLGGRLHWSLPDIPVPGEPASRFEEAAKALLSDIDGDGHLELFVTDGGCSRAGTGRGVVYTFDEVAEGARFVGAIGGPRSNGRCTRWNSMGDVHPAAGTEILITDAVGFRAFSADGTYLACGEALGGPASGAYPHLVARLREDDPQASIVAAWQGQVAVLTIQPDAEGACAAADSIVASVWKAPAGTEVSPGGLTLVDVDGDGTLDVVVSAWRGDAWHLVALSGVDGHELFDAGDLLLVAGADLDGDGTVEVLTAPAAPVRPGRFLELGLGRITAAGIQPIGPGKPGRAVIRPANLAPDRTDELAAVAVADGAFALLEEAEGAVGSGIAGRLTRLNMGGEVVRALEGEPGAARGTCDPAGRCVSGPLAASLVAGGLALFDDQLELLNLGENEQPATHAPSGIVQTVVALDDTPTLVTLTSAAVLSGRDPEDPASERWSTTLSRDGDTPGGLLHAPLPAEDLVFVAERSGGDVRWTAITALNRAIRWSHGTPTAQYLPRGAQVWLDGDGEAQLLIRHDLFRTPEAYAADPACGDDRRSAPDLFAPAEACPNRAIAVRAITALSVADGSCQWRTVIRANNPCTGPSNQGLSLADADGDGLAEIYLTESNAVRRIDPQTGEITATQTIPAGPDGTARGGGWIRPATPLLRVGGNGAIEALDADLQQIWRAELPEQRPQGWVVRDALRVADAVWISPGRGLPIFRYALANGAVLGSTALNSGVVTLDGPLGDLGADIGTMRRVENLFGPGDHGIFVVADDGFLYALHTDGSAGWVRQLPAVVGGPTVADLDGDGVDELLVSLANGALQIYGEPGPQPPEAAWDLSCPGQAMCDPDADIDETTSTLQLCAEWVPQADAAGYEARVVTRDGEAPVTEWAPTELDRAAVDLNELSLIPGVTYCVQIRAFREISGRTLRSAPVSTDCVTVVDDLPPTLTVTADAECFTVGEPLLITFTATDNDLLSGWALNVRDEEERLVRTLGVGPLAQAEFQTVREWDGTNTSKDPARPAGHQVTGVVLDRAGNATTAIVRLLPCP